MSRAPRARAFGARRIELSVGDITHADVDAVVNAANSSLLGGGGVDGAIHRAGGPAILDECRRIRARRGPLPAGEAVLTAGGQLRARHVIHTVGPVWQGGGAGEAAVLARCYRSSLRLAADNAFASVAFPSISTGAFGYPVDAAAGVALATVADVLGHGSAPDLVRFVLFRDGDFDAYAAVLDALP